MSSIHSYSDYHGENIAEVMLYIKQLLLLKKASGHKMQLDKSQIQATIDYISAKEKQKTHAGVNFSRIQIDQILKHHQQGLVIEFETFSPYLANYFYAHGEITEANLLPQDRIGLHIAVALRRLFPTSRLVCLYDDYTTGLLPNPDQKMQQEKTYSKEVKEIFRKSILEQFKTYGALSDTTKEGDYLLISEAQKTLDVEDLITLLADKGYIMHKNNEIFFVNDDAENQLYRQVLLQKKNGRWTCEALDAATFLKKENLNITHIIALPDNLKTQQDKVWEILRVLGFRPDKYHNIFFDATFPAEKIVANIEAAFTKQ